MSGLEAPASSRRFRYIASFQEYTQRTKQDLYKKQQYNLCTFRRQPLAEISGSFGDLGTLIPILIALTLSSSISLPSTLIFSGLANIYTGVLFGIPLPVQPMKAIAAVTIAQNFRKEEMASAGLFVAGAIGVLSLSGGIKWFTSKVPVPVIKGIQVGTGLSLITSAGKLNSVPRTADPALSAIVLLLAFLALLASSTFRRVPYALILLIFGIFSVLTLDIMDWTWYRNHQGHGHWSPALNMWRPHVFVPSWRSFERGALDAGVGQLPLTTLNSVIAVAFLAQDLLPEVKAPSTTSLGLSVAAINLVGCWFGAMPVCHGSGGLAAQYRFGARSGASVIFLGLLKLLLGMFASNITLHVLFGFPSVLLCILIIAAGLELVNVGESLNTAEARDLSPLDRASADDQEVQDSNDKRALSLTEDERKRRWAVMFMTVAGILAFKNDAVGFLAGILCHWSFQWRDLWEGRRSRREGRIRLEADTQDDSNARESQPQGP